jgi:hypothetical protein
MALLLTSGKTQFLREAARLSKHLADGGASEEAIQERLRHNYPKERKHLEAIAREACLSPLMAEVQRGTRLQIEKINKAFEDVVRGSINRLEKSNLLKPRTLEESLEVMYNMLKKRQ